MARRQAGPPASEVLAALRKALAGGFKPGLTVLTGDDMFHLDRAQKALLAALLPDEAPELALTVFGDEAVAVGTVVSAARSAGMFASRRVVLVRDLDALDGEADALESYAKQPPRDSFLIVRAVNLDQRFKLHKALVKLGATYRFVNAAAGDPRRMSADLRAMAAARNLELDRDAADFLAEASGGDLYRLETELEKIATWLGEGESRVSLDVAREVGCSGEMLSGWEVANAVTMRERGLAIAAVSRLIESGIEPLLTLGGLAWRARIMLQAKAMLEGGSRPDQVVSATRAWGFKNELGKGMKRYSLAELLRFPSILLDADRTLKSRTIAPRLVLENLVDRLTETAAGLESEHE